MESLTNRLKPYLRDGVSFDSMDTHTRQALDIYVRFRASALIDLPPTQIKAEIDKMPEAVRGFVRNKARSLYANKFLPNPLQ